MHETIEFANDLFKPSELEVVDNPDTSHPHHHADHKSKFMQASALAQAEKNGFMVYHLWNNSVMMSPSHSTAAIDRQVHSLGLTHVTSTC
jgi:hypothetical protein